MADTATKPRLKARYQDEIKSSLREQFGFENVMQIPGVVKVVVNMGVGDAAKDSKLIEGAVRDLTAITGQKPVVTKARKSIAQFKLREGMPIGGTPRCVATACGSSSTASSARRCPVSVTSVACRPSSSTAVATTRSV